MTVQIVIAFIAALVTMGAILGTLSVRQGRSSVRIRVARDDRRAAPLRKN